MAVRRITTISLITSLIIVFTIAVPSIQVPVIGVPFTLQTFIIMLAGLILSPKDAFISIFLYVLIGALGFPVFSGGTTGLRAIFGPTGGFIISFPFIAYFISLFHHGKHTFIKNYVLTILFGIGFSYVIGIAWMYYVYVNANHISITIWQISISMLSFIPLDLLKGIFASSISLKLEEYHIIYPQKKMKYGKTHNFN